MLFMTFTFHAGCINIANHDKSKSYSHPITPLPMQIFFWVS